MRLGIFSKPTFNRGQRIKNSNKSFAAAILGFAIGSWAQIPFPTALDAAAVVQTSIDNIDTKGMVIGNGDINALIWSSGGYVMMRVSKNDAWDARVITANDPDGIPWVNVANHTFGGHSGDTPSWSNPYPALIAPADFILGPIGTNIRATLDLKRAVAEITSSAGTIRVRALFQKNVFLVESGATVTMQALPQGTLSFIPAPTFSTVNGVRLLRQNLPGDPDYPGMDVYVALATGSSHKTISMVTSREDATAQTKAPQLAAATLAENPSLLIQNHESAWSQFWSRSGVQLGDKTFEKWWYRMVYWFGSFTKPGVVAMGLKAGWNSVGNWHGDYHTNYNMWQTFWTAFNTNHAELAEPMIDMLSDYQPRARYYAKTAYNLEGAALTISLYPFEPDPAVCVSKNKRMVALNPWGMTLGNGGQMVQNLWLHFLYKQDTAYLRQKTYPLLKDYALFYAAFIEACAKTGGKAILGPSYDPEHGSMGIDNSPYDIAYVRFTLKAAIQAAGILGLDPPLVARWTSALNATPDYVVNNGIVVNWRNAVVGTVSSYNIPTIAVPVFPGEQVSWFSPPSEKTTFQNTINWVADKVNKNNSQVMLNVARARLSMTSEATSDTKTWWQSRERPNGLFDEQAHGPYFSQVMAIASTIGEFLLQSNENILRIFPSWPANQDAKFAGLLAQGAFAVTAEQTGGIVTRLEITAKVGGKLSLVSPWDSVKVKRGGVVTALVLGRNKVVEVNTQPGETLIFSPFLDPTTVRHAVARARNPGVGVYKVVGRTFRVPREYQGKSHRASVYDLSGQLMLQRKLDGTGIFGFGDGAVTSDMHLVKFEPSLHDGEK